MHIEISEKLKPTLKRYENDLQIQSIFLPEEQIVEQYLKRGFGNTYDFDQQDRLAEAI